MRIVVTGAGGFVGPYLMDELSEAGHEVVGWTLSDGDLTEETTRRTLLKDHAPEALIHLAALSGYAQCEADPSRTWDINTRLVEELARDYADVMPEGRLLFISSGKIYDASATPIGEDGALDPPDLYGLTKLAADLRLGQLAQELPITILRARPFNHTGAGQSLGFLCPDLVDRLQSIPEDAPATISVGSLNSVVDISDVRDIAAGYRLYLEHGTTGSVMNFGSGAPRTVGEVVEALSHASGREIIPQVTTEHDRSYTAHPRVADVTRAREELSWMPARDLVTTLSDLWRA